MRAKAVGFVAVAALTAIFATSARAHICILKNGYYDLSDPYVCDGGDGTKVLDADFYTLDSEIELDVVFQQDFILKKQLDAYQSKIRFDPGMSDPAFCNCHDQRIDKGAPPLGVDCEENKRDVCRDYPVIWNDISSVLYLSLLDNFITIEGSDYYARVAMGTLTASAPAENLLMQSLVFSNIYSSEQEAAYTFSFEPWTNLYDENFCELLTETCGASVQHRAMETRLNMLQHVQYAPQPRIISVECAPKAGCGGGEAGEACACAGAAGRAV
nr:hypothetical protein [bacterium]